MERYKYNKGITLISLIITIIILIILAGISIGALTGNNGLFAIVQQAKTDVQVDQESENSTLENYLYMMEQTEGESGSTTENAEATTTIYQVAGTVVENGKTYSQVAVTIKITNKSSLGTVDSIKLINPGSSEVAKEATLIGDNTADASFKVSSNGRYTLEIKATTNSQQTTAQKTVDVQCITRLQTANVPVSWTETTPTNADWYSYGTATIAGTPKLVGNMAPVVYDGSVTGNKWANAVTTDGSMFVWIPRYAYKIPSGSHTNTASTIQVKFIDTDNNFLDGTSETITADPEEDGAGTTKWLVHPAFTDNADNGGGFGNLTGFWFGKYEATGTLTNITVKPGVTSIRSQRINDMWNSAKSTTSASLGETVDLKQHMVKNSEWGAVAYLAQSSFGTNGQKIQQNTDSGYITGGSTTINTIYTTNANQSTTYNAYGIYDLNGGAGEYVASYVNNGDANLGTYGADMTANSSTSTAYKTVYKSTTTTGVFTEEADYNLLNTTGSKKRGDAVWETSNTCMGAGSWFSAYSIFPCSSIPFFVRGGIYDDSYASSFFFAADDGVSDGYCGFRLALGV